MPNPLKAPPEGLSLCLDQYETDTVLCHLVHNENLNVLGRESYPFQWLQRKPLAV
jgi:hypothetical protein